MTSAKRWMSGGSLSRIEGQEATTLRQVDESLQQSIIGAVDLLPDARRSVPSESAQRLRIGKARHARQVLKGTVRTVE